MTQATARQDHGGHAHGHAHAGACDHAHEHPHDDGQGDVHGHSHGLGHHHHAPPDGFDRAFALGAALNLGFVVVEAGFGFVANSVALLADAAHNLGDVLGLLLAWGAAWLARRRPTRERTYGYGRGTILASLTNAVVLLVGVGAILLEAGQRLLAPGEATAVGGRTVMLVAAAGILVNGVTALLFARGRHGDLNVRGAFLHMVADALVSAGVVVSGGLVLLLGWWWIDSVVSVGIAVLILVSTWGLLRSSLDLAMDKVPEGVDPDAVRGYLAGLPGVSEVHDLHVWGLSTTRSALTAHLVHAGGNTDALLREASDGVRRRYGIAHATFQVETPGGAADCALRPECCG